jgi:hypothetical protein
MSIANHTTEQEGKGLDMTTAFGELVPNSTAQPKTR